MTRTIATVQRDFALNSAYSDDIIWDFLASDQDYVLKQKINLLVPDRENGMRAVKNTREAIFKNTWTQKKYTNGNLHSAIIYVMVTDDQPEYIEIASRAKDAVKFSCHPVFRTKKCMLNGSSNGCCMIFIDEVGRVYQNWKEYVEGNVLPAGFMVAPTHGVYSFDENDQVPLLCFPTPANSTKRKVFSAADTAASFGGLAAATIPIAALAIPVAAPIAAASVAVGLCTAAYSTVRSGLDLKDRRGHEQSISLADRSARGSWLGVFGGVAAVGAVGATKALTKAAAAGRNITKISQVVVNGINISSIILSGSGVANGVFDVMLKWKDSERVSSLNLTQFAASLIIFTHSVHNFRLASSIANQARDGMIKKYRSGLNNHQKKMFDKMAKETMRIHGETKGKMDIIRVLNEVPGSQSSNDPSTISKEINEDNFNQNSGGDVIKNVLTKICNQSESVLKNFSSVNTLMLASNCGSKFMKTILSENSLENAIYQIRKQFSDQAVNFFLRLANTFIETSLDVITSLLKTVISTETILWKMFTHCKLHYKDRTVEFLKSQSIEILDSLEAYFLSWRTIVNAKQLRKCPHCVGYYGIVNL